MPETFFGWLTFGYALIGGAMGLAWAIDDLRRVSLPEPLPPKPAAGFIMVELLWPIAAWKLLFRGGRGL